MTGGNTISLDESNVTDNVGYVGRFSRLEIHDMTLQQHSMRMCLQFCRDIAIPGLGISRGAGLFSR